MSIETEDSAPLAKIAQAASATGIDLKAAAVRRTSSRLCLGVEHGDYNGTRLFGAGIDRFLWLAYKGNSTDRLRLFSVNFPDDGIIEFRLGQVPAITEARAQPGWGRFAYGLAYILQQERLRLKQGIDGIIYSNIPGGGLSRSASLTLNLILSMLEVNDIELTDKFKIIEMAQAVENVYIGSPSGQLDQIMILFARAGMGTHYDPQNRSIEHIQLGAGAEKFRLVILDTGTSRAGLETSRYKVRRQECNELVRLLQEDGNAIQTLGQVKQKHQFEQIVARYGKSRPDLVSRLKYIYQAQQRFEQMLSGWRDGDMEAVGKVFREDGYGLRDDYDISGPELETMCEIARTVPGVLGERMLGGGDKGAAGAIVRAEAVDALKEAVGTIYPRRHPEYADKHRAHVCRLVDGVKKLRMTDAE